MVSLPPAGLTSTNASVSSLERNTLASAEAKVGLTTTTQAQTASQSVTEKGQQVTVSISSTARYQASVAYSQEASSGNATSHQEGRAASSEGVERYQAIEGDSDTRTQAASNILSFVALRLERDLADGATAEELGARLSEGLDGFLKGFNEAFEQISKSGLLTEEVNEAIQATRDQVLAGIDDLAEAYGIESPVTDALRTPPVGEIVSLSSANATNIGELSTGVLESLRSPVEAVSSLLEGIRSPADDIKALLDSTTVSVEREDKRDFSFELKTRDGDVVTITANSERSSSYQAAVERSPGYQVGAVAGRSETSNQFSLSVEGDLDDDELRAIADLLDQVSGISESFFSGNLEEAFSKALDIGFDADQIANFSLNLRQEATTRVETTYQRIGEVDSGLEETLGQQRQALADLSQFFEQFAEAQAAASELGIGQALLFDLVEFSAQDQQERAENEEQERSEAPDRLRPFLSDVADFLAKDVSE